ncbi:DUF2922 domain-containing protein [Cellulosilyticum sp. ST5]|uniref:DUF2922 domain-containing protein n=1 Tax=Cellulosilyticum sp. ST5 TaxID=3055805 RepID=UPI003977E295
MKIKRYSRRILTITKPKEGLTSDEISSAMTDIIAANALGEDSLVATKVSTKYVVQQTEAITLA